MTKWALFCLMLLQHIANVMANPEKEEKENLLSEPEIQAPNSKPIGEYEISEELDKFTKDNYPPGFYGNLNPWEGNANKFEDIDELEKNNDENDDKKWMLEDDGFRLLLSAENIQNAETSSRKIPMTEIKENELPTGISNKEEKRNGNDGNKIMNSSNGTVQKTGNPNPEKVLKLIDKYPEKFEAFIEYLNEFDKNGGNGKIEKMCGELNQNEFMIIPIGNAKIINFEAEIGPKNEEKTGQIDEPKNDEKLLNEQIARSYVLLQTIKIMMLKGSKARYLKFLLEGKEMTGEDWKKTILEEISKIEKTASSSSKKTATNNVGTERKGRVGLGNAIPIRNNLPNSTLPKSKPVAPSISSSKPRMASPISSTNSKTESPNSASSKARTASPSPSGRIPPMRKARTPISNSNLTGTSSRTPLKPKSTDPSPQRTAPGIQPKKVDTKKEESGKKAEPNKEGSKNRPNPIPTSRTRIPPSSAATRLTNIRPTNLTERKMGTEPNTEGPKTRINPIPFTMRKSSPPSVSTRPSVNRPISPATKGTEAKKVGLKRGTNPPIGRKLRRRRKRNVGETNKLSSEEIEKLIGGAEMLEKAKIEINEKFEEFSEKAKAEIMETWKNGGMAKMPTEMKIKDSFKQIAKNLIGWAMVGMEQFEFEGEGLGKKMEIAKRLLDGLTTLMGKINEL